MIQKYRLHHLERPSVASRAAFCNDYIIEIGGLSRADSPPILRIYCDYTLQKDPERKSPFRVL